jgi:hypothetical protein
LGQGDAGTVRGLRLDLYDPQSGSEAAHIGRVRGYDDITARGGDQRDLPIDHIGRTRRRQ